MCYTIKEFSEITGVSPHTIRYYDNEGLFTKIERNQWGRREFDERNVEQLNTIIHLKKTGMQLKEIKHFMELSEQGVSTCNERIKLFIEQKKKIENQIKEFEDMLEIINEKCCELSHSKNTLVS